MTIDEVIKNEEKLAELNEDQAQIYREQDDILGARSYEECANEHRQLAKWLRELKEYRAILDELKDAITSAHNDLIESENEYGENARYTENDRGYLGGLLYAYEMFGREYEEVNADDE